MVNVANVGRVQVPMLAVTALVVEPLSGGGEEVADGLVGERGGHVRGTLAPISSRYMLKMKSADCP